MMPTIDATAASLLTSGWKPPARNGTARRSACAGAGVGLDTGIARPSRSTSDIDQLPVRGHRIVADQRPELVVDGRQLGLHSRARPILVLDRDRHDLQDAA